MLQSLIKNIFIYGICSVISRLSGILLVPIFTRSFSTQQYGVFDLIYLLVSLACILGTLQLDSALMRFFHETLKENTTTVFVSTALWSVISLSIFYAIVLCCASPILSLMLFKTKEYAFVICIASLNVPLINVLALLTILIRFVNKPISFLIAMFMQFGITILFSLWFVLFLKMGIPGVFWGQFVGLIPSCLFLWIVLRQYIGFKWEKKVLGELLKYSLPEVPAAGASWINFYGNRFIMLSYLSISQIGLYSVALKIASLFTLFQSAFRMAWWPFFWEKFQKPEHKMIYKTIFKSMVVLVFSLIIIMTIFSKDIFKVFASSTFLGGAKLLGILFLSIGLNILTDILAVGPTIKKKMQYNTLISFIAVGINIAFLYVMVPRIGIVGVPLSLLLGSVASLVLFWIISEKMYYIGFSRLLFVLFAVFTSIIIGFIYSINEVTIAYKMITVILFVVVALTIVFNHKFRASLYNIISQK